MKTRTQKFTVLDFVYTFGLLVFGEAATVANIAFLSPILPGLSQKLYVIPGILAWIAIIYLLVIGLAAEIRENHQSPSLVIISQENTIRNIRDAKYYAYQKIQIYSPYSSGRRYQTKRK